MSNNHSARDYGQQFKNELNHALESGDFSGLQGLVNETVNAAVDGALDQVAKATGAKSAKEDAMPRPDQIYEAQPGSYKEETLYREPEASSAEHYGRYTKNYDNVRAHNYDRKTPNYDQPDPRRPRPGRTEQFHQKKSDSMAQVRAEIEKQQQIRAMQRREELALFRQNGKVSGTLMQVFGGTFLAVFGCTSLFLLILYVAVPSDVMLTLLLVCMGLTGGSFGTLIYGTNKKNRFKRAKRYFELCRDTGYMNVDMLAGQTSQSIAKLVKELKKLIEDGTFAQGHLDAENKCFMLTDSVYEEYCRVSEMRQDLLEESKRKEQLDEAKKMAAMQEEEQLSPQQKALRSTIAEGHDYIRQIRQKNELIEGEVISQKLFYMESLLKEIFANLERMPEQLPKMQKLMHYYLPTTLKLVSAYEQFDHMSVQGEEIVSAKREIENTIDTINDAYGQLLNKLFTDSALDVTTDAQVLKTMLAQEGLVKENSIVTDKKQSQDG